MGFSPPAFLCQWKTPKHVVIQDKRLGAIYWTMKILVLIFVVTSCVKSGTYKWSEVPEGSPTFWFESAGLYAAQNQTNAYCDNAGYDYQYNNKRGSYWNDVDIGCQPLHYGEIVRKQGGNGFVLTFFKEEHTRSKACTSQDDTCPRDTAWTGKKTHHFGEANF